MKRKILLVVTGAQTIHKTKKLLDILKREHEVRVVVSDFVRKNFAFVNELEAEMLNSDLDAIPTYLELGKWADSVVVYPASANTMAKYAAGVADTMLLTMLFTTPRDIMFFPSINDGAVYDGLMARNIISTIESLGDLVIWPNEIHDRKVRESHVSVSCEPEEAFEYITNVVNSRKKKAVILYGDPVVATSSHKVYSLATPAAIKVLKRAFVLEGFDVEAINVTRQSDNVLVERLIKTEWDSLLSTITFEDTKDEGTGMPIDLKVNYDSLGKIRMMFPKRQIVGFKYCEFEVDALRKLHTINLDGIFWNKTSLMTNTRVTGKFFIHGQSHEINNLTKEDAAVVIAKAMKKNFIIHN